MAQFIEIKAIVLIKKSYKKNIIKHYQTLSDISISKKTTVVVLINNKLQQ